MTSRIFRINLIVRLLVLFLLGNTALFLVLQTSYWMLSVWIFLFLLIGIAELIKYIEKNYKELSDFLMGVKENDFTYIANIRKNKRDKGLGKTFNHIADLVENLRLEAETNYQYLQTVVNHIEIGILCFEESGKINLVNNAAYRFFNLNSLSDIDKLKSIDEGFFNMITNLQPCEKKIYRLTLEGNTYQLAVFATHFKKEKKNFKLVSFQNIKGVLEEKEMESWYKLTRVLTHEIMNSAIPISNLSGMVYEGILDEDGRFRDFSQMDDESRQELKDSLKTIQSRSRGLVNFVSSTRKITRLPEPDLQLVDVVKLLNGIFSLFSQKLKNKNIHYEIENGEKGVQIYADPGQLEQVFINLLQNAIDALEDEDNPVIRVSIEELPEGKLVIRFIDNGKGMNKDEKENLFIPFYTTKKTGTGIGLSLSRQIIYNHKGEINVKSLPGQGTEFLITI